MCVWGSVGIKLNLISIVRTPKHSCMSLCRFKRGSDTAAVKNNNEVTNIRPQICFIKLYPFRCGSHIHQIHSLNNSPIQTTHWVWCMGDDCVEHWLHTNKKESSKKMSKTSLWWFGLNLIYGKFPVTSCIIVLRFLFDFSLLHFIIKWLCYSLVFKITFFRVMCD